MRGLYIHFQMRCDDIDDCNKGLDYAVSYVHLCYAYDHAYLFQMDVLKPGNLSLPLSYVIDR